MPQEEKKKFKILIIEDEHSLVDLLSTKLSKEGYEVKTSYDGETGYNALKDWEPDLVLLDIVMPKMNGYEVLEAINKDGLKTPVIIISNSGQPVEIEKTKKLGAIDHLIKTEFSPVDVIKKVKKCFEGGRLSEQEEDDDDDGVTKPRTNPDVRQNGVRVLLVEDDSFLREISSKKLTKEGYTVFEAIDGEQALKGVQKVKPDIVLLDIILPAIDGFQILSQIRASSDQAVAKVPVIMLSNLGQDDDIKKALDMGANDYLVKAHFTTEEIVEKIKTMVKK